MAILYRVETTTRGGMHEVLAITRVGSSGEDHLACDLGDTELALVRSAVRGHLDLVGLEAGSTVTTVDVDVDGEEPRILPAT